MREYYHDHSEIVTSRIKKTAFLHEECKSTSPSQNLGAEKIVDLDREHRSHDSLWSEILDVHVHVIHRPVFSRIAMVDVPDRVVDLTGVGPGGTTTL